MIKLALTGATGKKSGGTLCDLIGANIEQIHELFPGGVKALVRRTSDTVHLKKTIKGVDICAGELTNPEFL